jgi:hypothetical protein
MRRTGSEDIRPQASPQSRNASFELRVLLFKGPYVFGEAPERRPWVPQNTTTPGVLCPASSLPLLLALAFNGPLAAIRHWRSGPRWLRENGPFARRR